MEGGREKEGEGRKGGREGENKAGVNQLKCFLQASGDQRVFRVRKGVSTVDYCPKNNVIITGSVDQVIRIWNPFVTR